MSDPAAFKNRIANDLRFLKGWVKQPKSVGSITPTNKQAAELMTSLIPHNSELPILELGPGTGPITKAILNSGIAPEQLISIEYNKDFYNHLSQTYPGVTFIQGDAFDLKKTLEDYSGQKFSAILSGLPLLNFSSDKRAKFIEDGLSWLAPGAPFIQLCYGPRPPVKAQKGKFTAYPSKWVLSNVPPARFWVYKDEVSN